MKKILMTASTQSHFIQFHCPYFTALAQKKWEVHLAYPHPTESFVDVTQQHHIPFTKKYFHWKNVSAMKSLVKLMKQEEYDCLVTHTTLASFWTRLALVFVKHPPRVVCVVHGYLFHQNMNPLKQNILLMAEKLLRKQTDCILTMNDYDYKMAVQHHLGGEIHPIHGMGVAQPQVKVLDKSLTATLQGLPEEAFLLAYGGEFSKRKNQSFLIKAMVRCPKSVHLILAGSGLEETHCKHLAKQLDLEERVHFVGQVPSLPSLYSLVDLVVSSSQSEGLPFHLLEAMALGKPAFCSRVKGHEDVLAEGFLYDLDNETQFVNNLCDFIEHTEILQEAGQILQENWEKNYAVSQVMPQVLEHYTGKGGGAVM